MIDFNRLTRPSPKTRPLDPAEIFAKTPNLKNAPNDLWKGQADALSRWHSMRSASDVGIILNTGAGKSLVGILIAQSMVNEQIGPIIYACSTIDLVNQAARECAKLGIEYTTRVRGGFSNDLFETGRAFCITTYQAVFSPINAFRNDRAPAGIIFDDAHVAERLIRDSFTLTVSKSAHPDLYASIVSIIRPEFDRVHKEAHLDVVLSDISQQSVTLCPPATAARCGAQILEALKSADYKKLGLLFPFTQLYDNIRYCAIFVSSNAVEITPPFIPTARSGFLEEGVRRVYLSATMDYETDFARGFGRKLPSRIEPDNDAGNGERLIILARERSDKKRVAGAILKRQKLLIAVSSYNKSKEWSSVALPPNRDNFTAELDKFRSDTSGAFVLVSRIDGIDLPQDTCRVMLIDGAPSGASLMDQYLFSQLSLNNLFSTKMAGRITQLLGRINRGRSDYGAFLMYGRDLTNWIRTERNLALLPQLIRKQIILGQSLADDIEDFSSENIASIIEQVIARDAGWLKFYRDTVDGLEVSDEALAKVRAREAQLATSAVAECAFMNMLWQGDIEGARKSLIDVMDQTALADSKLAGWYAVWLGMTYEIQGDMTTAITHYSSARSRLSAWLNLPFREVGECDKEGPALNSFQGKLLSVSRVGAGALADLTAKLRVQERALLADKDSDDHEEALRLFGELMGYQAHRPDNEDGSGPDVIWMDAAQKAGIAFELKTKKKVPAEYNKKEIGQSLNHAQWLADNHSDYMFSGVLIVGPPGRCRPDASPSDTLFLVETGALATRMRALIAKIDDARGQVAEERHALLSALGALPEWQINGWFGALATTSMKSVQSKKVV